MSFSDGTPPLIEWLKAIIHNNAGSMENTDLILTEKGAKRFLIGVHEKTPLLCWNEHDAKALETIKWTSAALAYGLKHKDWFALSCQDIRIKDSEAKNPIRFRIFIPVLTGRLDVWKEVNPSLMTLGRYKKLKGAHFFDGTPFATVPVKMLGN